ncbi:acylneuraminate cytidylyltransferase [Candidatus Dependentiae bacterium]|nr:acylneuraminate cytidylyltransferase [Candidatus Dependentiae bacterium]
MNGRTGAIIQARMKSKRLPGKVLLSLPYNSEVTVLDNIVQRAKCIKKLNEVIVATSWDKNDDIIEQWCKKKEINCFRGDVNDVLSRYYYSAKQYNLETILRLTGDNPCIDFELISNVLDKHLQDKNDCTKTEYYPIGTNIEIFSFGSLKKTFLNTTNFFDREHVTSFIYKNKNMFNICIKEAPKKLRKNLRLTLDTRADYLFFCAIFDFLYDSNNFFKLIDVIHLMDYKPWIKKLNENVFQKKEFQTLDDELKFSIKLLDCNELYRAKNILKMRIG